MARPAETAAATRRVLAELERRELLLQAGREFPSVAHIVVGEEIRGSWWAHPQSNLIYWVCQDLEAHPKVMEARLVAGKVTQLWHSVWADVVAVALARAPWQLADLSRPARRLLDRVDDSPVRTDALKWWSDEQKLGDVCRLLERRLLVKSEEIHTEGGRHAKSLTSWGSWWREHGAGKLPVEAAARTRLEKLVGGSTRLLPWVITHSAMTGEQTRAVVPRR